ncbi:Putative monooxygenase moxC [Alysiella crassa]|uniref:Monooxygenase moxC n=2 Tax=Alysiella crassa TaxID=153491 RepID=A0A376BMX4_9NEIS|nr:Putative monooxygenase moxC [Alysiella crassa]
MALRQSAIDNGRNPDDIKFIAGIMPLIADSKQEALDRHAFFMDEQTLYQRVRHIGAVLGTVFDLDDLDKPIDPAILDKVQITPYSDPRTEIVLKVAREGWTLKEVIHHSVIDYHPASVGTAEDTADFMTEWFNEGACDGFWVLPDVYEVDLKRFVDEVVPILQERGVFHQDYEGDTLREHLGVPYQYGLRK